MLTQRLSIHPAEGTWVIRAGGAVIGESRRALELREENYLPVIYFPKEDLGMAFFDRSATTSTCPFKGKASYFSISTHNGMIADAGWSYENPTDDAERIAGHVAFYPSKVTIERV